MKIDTRLFGDDDLPAVLDVLVEALGETPLLRRSRELFEWKHRLNPFGGSIILLAVAGERIAGIRAIMRWDLVSPSGSRIRCGRMVDTATHPDFQRLGIFRRLTMEAVEASQADGIQLLFNTPNPKSGAGYLSMGWERVGPVGVMVRPSWRARRRDLSLEHELPDVGAFFPTGRLLEPIEAVDRAPTGLRTPRSDAYLEWRYRSHPTARYGHIARAGGVAVGRPNHRSGRRELVVSDLLGEGSRSALSAMLAEARYDYAVAWFSKGSPERSAAMRSGLMPVPGVTALELMARPLTDMSTDVFDPASWDLSLGDLELL